MGTVIHIPTKWHQFLASIFSVIGQTERHRLTSIKTISCSAGAQDNERASRCTMLVKFLLHDMRDEV